MKRLNDTRSNLLGGLWILLFAIVAGRSLWANWNEHAGHLLTAVLVGVVIGSFLSWLTVKAWVMRYGVAYHIARHLGITWKNSSFLRMDISSSRSIDMRRGRQVLCMDGQMGDTAEVGTIRRETIEVGADSFEILPINASYLLVRNGGPCVVSFIARGRNDFYELAVATVDRGILRVLSLTQEGASEAIRSIMRSASKGSFLRGKLLQVSPGRDAVNQAIQVCDKPVFCPTRMTLAGELLAVLNRCVVEQSRNQDLLASHGLVAKTGVLLYGLPRTGKTLLCKHLSGACSGHTAIVPTAMEPETIREVFRLASYHQPALVIIEEVDLLATRREINRNVTGMQELINEMAGPAPGARALIFAAARTGSREPPVCLADHDFDETLYELVIFGGDFTCNILGVPNNGLDLP